MTKAEHTPLPNQPAAIPGLRRRVMLARLALVWETVWQSLWQLACALAFFLALSLFDIWRLVPAIVHWVMLLALALFSAATIFLQRGQIRLPDRHSILARIERDNGLLHHPLRALEDRQELGAGTPDTRNLWRAHLLRIRQTLPRLKFVLPRPRAIRFDRHGLRQMAGILLIAGSFAAGPQWWTRIETGFTPTGLGPALPKSRLEAWITPPAYTGAAPVMLAGAAIAKASQDNGTQGSPSGDAVSDAPITVPAGSELSMRLFGGREAELHLTPDAGKKQRLPMTKADSANSHASVKLEQSQHVQLRQSGASNQEWQITVIPDQPPVISLLEDITVTRQYGLRFKYGATDDYGVVAAAAEITPVTGENSSPEAPLRVEFPTPQAAAKGGQVAYVDLTAHPWAGQPVRLHLIATDATGQTGRTKQIDLILPQRPFKNPLARAIIEQRRIVATEPANDKHTIEALDALSLYPDKFTLELPVYLAMRVARHKIKHIHGNEDARTQVVELLWRLALNLEDGDLSIAGSELRQLQNTLMQALRDGASDGEIANLTQALREALERYVQAMAEQALEDETPSPDGGQKNSGTINKSDLDALLNQIEKMSKSGAREAAQQMLSRLQNVLENMRPGQAGGQKSPAQKLYGGALKDLTSMMRQQQQLQDETYSQREHEGSGEGKGGLARDQEKLHGALDDLKSRLDQSATEDPPNSLGRAERAMQEAAKALRKGETNDALEQQSQTMDQLRAGAGALAKMLREADAKAQAENGDSDENGAPWQNKDPLGRPMASDSAGGAALPEQFDIERALQIRRELELRASQRRRPVEELNYIDRLLKLF